MESFMRRLSLPALSQAEKIVGAFNLCGRILTGNFERAPRGSDAR